MTDVKSLRKHLKKLRSRLADSEQTLEAIRTGKVDALMVFTSKGEQVFTLRGAERPYRVMVEQMAEGAVTFGRDGTILFCNHRFAELLGVPLEQIVGSQLFDYLPQTERLQFQEVLHGVNGVAGRAELQLLAGDGRAFPVNVSVTALELEESADAFSMVVNNLEEQRRLERQVLEVSEREQLRLGQDLHDGLGQVLAGISFMLQSIPATDREQPKELTRAMQLLNDALHQTRELAKGFYPVELERHGLSLALQELAENVQNTFRVGCRVTRNKCLDSIDKKAQIHLFRIIQESIRNAVRHGQARSIQIKAGRVGHEVVVSIQNDGLRFPTQKMRLTMADSQGMGLKIMHYRARLIGGNLEFTPGRKDGCVVRCTIPLSKRAAR
jgi:two-component system, LuxR family, sensor kinase FixL